MIASCQFTTLKLNKEELKKAKNKIKLFMNFFLAFS